MSRREARPNHSNSFEATKLTTLSPSSPQPADDVDDNTDYYPGVRGQISLVARSSTEPFIVRWNGTFVAAKRFYNVGLHSIKNIFDAPHGPRESILSILRHYSLGWLTLNVIRIGYEDVAADNPVVVLITVKAGAVSAVARAVVLECRDVLVKFELDDVHVEIARTGDFISEYASNWADDIPDVSYELVPPIGTSIGPKLDSEPQSSGSLGLYLKVRAKGNEHAEWQDCGLTCHHVVLPRKAIIPPDGVGQAFHPRNGFRVFVESPSQQDHEKQLKDNEIWKTHWRKQIGGNTGRVQRAEQGIDKPLSTGEESRLQDFEKQLADCINLEDTITKFDRNFGEVIATSGIQYPRPSEPLLDWALISLDRARRPNTYANLVPPSPFSPRRTSYLKRGLVEDHHLKEPFELDLKSIIPMNEITSPQVLDEDGFPSLRILKRGRTTGWTVGLSNEIQSNRLLENGSVSTEWCILDWDAIPKKVEPFSDAGDSGSFVFDFQGRLGGMLHGGEKPGALTFVTHVDHLFESIGKEFDIKLV